MPLLLFENQINTYRR